MRYRGVEGASRESRLRARAPRLWATFNLFRAWVDSQRNRRHEPRTAAASMSPIALWRRLASLALVLWVAFVPAVSSCSSASPDKRILQLLNKEGFGKRYVGNAQDQNYISIGDTVTYADSNNPEVRGTDRVDVDGTIQLPEVGAAWVAGLSREEAETYLNQKLSAYWSETAVKVVIVSGNAKTYYVLGEVDVPGAKPYFGDTTLFDAVLEARPTLHTSNLGRVRLIRADPRDPIVMSMDLSDMWERGDSTYNVQIHEYDIVYVPPTLFKQLADVISAVLVPITTVLTSIWNVLFFGFPGRYGYGNFNRGI